MTYNAYACMSKKRGKNNFEGPWVRGKVLTVTYKTVCAHGVDLCKENVHSGITQPNTFQSIVQSTVHGPGFEVEGVGSSSRVGIDQGIHRSRASRGQLKQVTYICDF